MKLEPLFVTDAELRTMMCGAAVPMREFAPRLVLLERQGFPQVDPRFGGRYLPAVRAFFDNQHGLGEYRLKAAGGIERPHAWDTKRRA